MFTKGLVVALLAAVAFGETAVRVSRVVAPDFYQLWAVSAAARLGGDTLGSPYKDPQGYWAVLTRQAESSPDARLKAVHRLWPGLSAVASPFLFALFSLLPRDYSTAVVAFASLQAVCFLTSMALLGWLYRYDRFLLLCLALILLRSYEPLFSDMRLGNIATFQLLALSGMLVLGERLRSRDRARHATALGAIFLAGLAFVAFAKLNVALVVMVMALQFLMSSERKTTLVAVPVAAAACIAFVLMPCAYFHGCGVWVDWSTHVVGPGREIAGRSVEQGNYSTTRILADLLGIHVTVPAIAVAVVLAATLLLAAYRARDDHRNQSRVAACGTALARAARGPGSAASIAITATMAVSPLMWLHYYVWSLIPALWAMRAGRGDSRVAGLGAASVGLSFGALNVLLALVGLAAAVPSVMALSWVPLWMAILLQVMKAPGAGEESRAGTEDARGAPPARGAGSDRGRSRRQGRTIARV